MGREESFTISTLNDFNGSLADLSIVNNCVKDTEQEHEWLFVSKPDRYVKIYQSSGHIMIHRGGLFVVIEYFHTIFYMISQLFQHSSQGILQCFV